MISSQILVHGSRMAIVTSDIATCLLLGTGHNYTVCRQPEVDYTNRMTHTSSCEAGVTMC